jgi:molybdopterin-containing oxidoreductase family membrane subunit
MSSERRVLGVFPDEKEAVAAIRAMAQEPWKLDRVHSPFPSHSIMDALGVKTSRVGYFTLAGGILGFIAGFALAVFTATQWNLIVWGKPVVAWIPFVIVGFEFTILFSVLGNVLGLLVLGDLPDFEGLEHYDPRCSGEHFGILATCPDGEQGRLTAFFRDRGGEVRVFE